MIEFFGGESPDDVVEKAARLARDMERFAKGTGPLPADLATAPVLDLYQDARRYAPALVGVAREHPTARGGRTRLTSEVFCLDRAAGWARSWSRLYRLGRPANILGRGLH